MDIVVRYLGFAATGDKPVLRWVGWHCPTSHDFFFFFADEDFGSLNGRNYVLHAIHDQPTVEEIVPRAATTTLPFFFKENTSIRLPHLYCPVSSRLTHKIEYL